MSMLKALVGIVVVGGLVAGGLTLSERSAKRSNLSRPTPPPDSECLAAEWDAASIIFAVAGTKKNEREEAAKSFVGYWNRSDGWEGGVEKITEESEGPALRMRIMQNGLIGGEYWIVALVPEDHGVGVGEIARVQGRIRSVTVKPVGAGVLHSIVLEHARLIR